MKKILLIEDRSKRQKDFLSALAIDLIEYEDILDNRIDDKYISFLEEIKNDNFDLTLYEVIIAHESIFTNENGVILSKLKTYCKLQHKALVLFSGNNSNSYNNNEYEELGLISSDLYSQNLVLFLKDFRKGHKNILILSYGERWKLNIVLNALEKISLFIDKHFDEEYIDYDEFSNFIQKDLLDSLALDFYIMNVNGSWVYLSETKEFKNDILKHISKMADE